MYISMGHMINLSTIKYLELHEYTTNYMICLLILTICFIIYGFRYFKYGYKNLIHKTGHISWNRSNYKFII